ncbi:MAG: cytochrome c oxidase subunit II [Bryobacteraceae bacterium]|nr:cytochrome c oxidase subunit II [Bryobacteraceae bacterium]
MNWFTRLFLPAQGSTHAPAVDNLFWFILWLSVFFFVLIAGLVLYFAARYRRKSADDRTPNITHHLGLELAWSIIPLFLCLAIFFWGFKDYMTATVAPLNAMEISLTGEKWIWTFEYPDGMRSIGELYVPVGKPVKLIMQSKDVLHSFFIPGFRIKMDVLPNRYTEQWFQSDVPGEYQVQCTEYCGKGHSTMNAKIVVMNDEEYKDYLENGPKNLRDMPLAELGKLLYSARGCETCHSLDGVKGQGPSWKGIFGQMHKMGDGREMMVDENYIRTSILQPQAMIVQGYEGIMPTYQGLLRDREILALIEFIKSQK